MYPKKSNFTVKLKIRYQTCILEGYSCFRACVSIEVMTLRVQKEFIKNIYATLSPV